MSKKILVLSDFDLRGSGYKYIAGSVAEGLSKRDFDVKAIGLRYDGAEHNFLFSILPAENTGEANAIIHNLTKTWKPDALVVLLDIPLQESFMRRVEVLGIPYIGIFPLESTPLSPSWAMTIMKMRNSFVMTKFGTQESSLYRHGTPMFLRERRCR